MKAGKFKDIWHGNGVFISFARVSIALRWRWHFYRTKVFGKPGYHRWYIGPVEIEIRRAARAAGRE